MSPHRMPFGKYKGESLSDIPLHYISWLLEQEFLKEPLRGWLEDEYEERTDPPPDEERAKPIPIPIDLNLVEELHAAGFRLLSKKYHPDLGGDTAKMTAL